MNIQQATIGVIGFGNFGKVVCNNLFAKNPIVLFSKKHHILLPKNITQVTSVKKLVEKAHIIIPCVPIRNFEETIKYIAPYVTPQQVVMDICSVKEYPVHIMEKLLGNTQIIATHPMFGPNSIQKRNGVLKGLPVVAYNVSAPTEIFDDIKQHFTQLLLDVIEMDPVEHDKLSAHSQFFALIIGEITQKLNLTSTSIDTPGAKAIFDATEYMRADRHIIEDLVKYNKYCLPLLNTMTEILSSLKNGESYA